MNTPVTRLMTLLGVLFLFTGGYATAQHCFRGKPCPQCRWFWITEAGVSYRFDNNDEYPQRNRRFYQKLLYSFDLALMHNLGKHDAIGVSLSAAYDKHQGQGLLGGRLRYRRWFGRSFGFDYAPGIVSNTEGGPHSGFSNLLVITAADLVALILRIDIVKWRDESDYEVCSYAGINLGSYAGLAAGMATFVVSAVAVIAFAASS
jgi:hypothetical protein